MTMFKTALALCGFSQTEAAEFFDARPDTVKAWSSGRRTVPAGVWRMLAELYEQIINVSEDALDTLDFNEMDEDALNAIALQQYGERLPAPAIRSALAMALLARLTD